MTSLLRAVRALAGLDNAALDAVTPNAMRAVMEARGWRSLGGGTWHWYAPPTGVNARHPEHAATVRVGDWPAIVRTWAAAVATRHGDVAPAEVLAEAMEVSE